jgi:hypothetical protein
MDTLSLTLTIGFPRPIGASDQNLNHDDHPSTRTRFWSSLSYASGIRSFALRLRTVSDHGQLCYRDVLTHLLGHPFPTNIPRNAAQHQQTFTNLVKRTKNSSCVLTSVQAEPFLGQVVYCEHLSLIVLLTQPSHIPVDGLYMGC